MLDKSTFTQELLLASGQFALQLLIGLAHLTVGVGSDSARDVPDKLVRHDVQLFQTPGTVVPLVTGCVGWLLCKRIPEPHNEQTYDLFIGEVVAAFSRSGRIFVTGAGTSSLQMTRCAPSIMSPADSFTPLANPFRGNPIW